MRLRPVASRPTVLVSMPQTKGQDLLFEFLEHLAMVIAHSDEFLDLLILGAGNMNRAVRSVCQALRNICGIASVGLDSLPTAWGRQRGGR